jgi:hypothetical protein
MGDRFPSTGKPKFVMVGIDRPGGGVRLYASRDIPERELHWGLATGAYGDATGWHIDAEMRMTLITDADTWGAAFARLFEIWENHDRNNAIEEAQGDKAVLAANLIHFAADGSRHRGTQRDCQLCAPERYALPMCGGIED